MSENVGERTRESSSQNVGSGLQQRARADGAAGRPGRPMVQRTRNASFAIPKMRSPSFMLREKEDTNPEANASPWGVEDDRKSEADPKALAERQLGTRVSRKVSLMAQPTRSGISFSSPRRQKEPALTHSPSTASPAKPKGILKSQSRAVNDDGQAADSGLPSGAAITLSSPVSSASPVSAASLAIREASEDGLEGCDALVRSKGKSVQNRTNSGRKASTDAEGVVKDKAKNNRAQDDAAKLDSKKNQPRKSRFGLTSKIRSAMHYQRKEGDGDGGVDDFDDDDDGSDGDLAKVPSMAADDFISYQTKTKSSKATSRKSRMTLRSGQ